MTGVPPTGPQSQVGDGRSAGARRGPCRVPMSRSPNALPRSALSGGPAVLDPPQTVSPAEAEEVGEDPAAGGSGLPAVLGESVPVGVDEGIKGGGPAGGGKEEAVVGDVAGGDWGEAAGAGAEAAEGEVVGGANAGLVAGGEDGVTYSAA